ncbi:unnamed protein product (macronuclear) [Paramecium tetraurelia]|uniref:Myb-like domain-containing protein n=1 Tax=Paramecium tetraurelia TaxID=5888 RepID=A0E960_PARTE|nr:uncharacterized protein GSPATT00024558001 [Paramecium tetraurelia]CAK91827.1 unnamed protein product [Paramecium tetraurelia]|eukprot:XP_001459224.1 hypothetical protein (macronuclear) [Paramecium tetraurelia strain d4-2]
MNLINGNPLFQTLFLNNLLYNPQIFQYMISQMQYIPRVDLRGENTKTQEDQNSDRKIQKQEKLTQNSKQLLVGSETDQPPKGNTDSDDEESSSRVNGHWSKLEHQLYLQFVNDHEEILRSKYDKKSKKIFKLMSQCILTRTATQCRSHHQKFNPLQKSKRKGKSFVRPIPSVIIQEN